MTDADGFKKQLKIMKQNCYRLLRLVNNLIDITKIDAGYFQIQLQNFNIVHVVEDIVQSVAEYIHGQGIHLLFDTEVEEKMIACEPEKIEIIMLNLLSNAIKFTHEGGKILVTVYDGHKKISISVKDTGVGIPNEQQTIIFERFRQGDKSLTRNYEGSGIGLSLVKALVEMHEGTITVRSEQGNGSEFIIELPVKVIEDDENIKENEISKGLNDYIDRINIEFSDIYTIA